MESFVLLSALYLLGNNDSYLEKELKQGSTFMDRNFFSVAHQVFQHYSNEIHFPLDQMTYANVLQIHYVTILNFKKNKLE